MAINIKAHSIGSRRVLTGMSSTDNCQGLISTVQHESVVKLQFL